MRRNRVIFLDIDGVVNTIWISRNGPGRTHNNDGYYYDLCSPSDGRVSNPQAILWLEKICKETGAKIVLSSTWRINYEGAVTALRNSGLSEDVDIIGRTGWKRDYRGDEIQDYLNEHPEITSFVIIDDDIDMKHLISHLVQTDTDVGITFRTYKQVMDKFRELENTNI